MTQKENKAGKPLAGQPFPSLAVPKLNGGTLQLGTPQNGHDWQMVVVYRGKHCPICTQYLQELNAVTPALHALGVDVVAVSADSAERATDQMAEVNPSYPVGYDLSIEQMQALGLYISGPRSGIDVERPFAEPALFVINDQGLLQMLDISNVPFARPDLHAMVKGLSFVRPRAASFPINGAYAA